MSFFQMLPQSPQSRLAEMLGAGLAEGVDVRQQRGQQQAQQSQLAQALFGSEQAQQMQGIPLDAQLKMAQIQAQKNQMQQKLLEQREKEEKERKESEILSKYQRGEEITPQEQAQLSPTSQRALIGLQKPMYEPTAERLEAERVFKFVDEVNKDYRAASDEDMRLNRMEKLSKKGDLSTPLMVKTLDTMGLPLSILGNPDTEEFQKLEADFVRDVSKVFPGQIRVFEIQAYMKTVPGLINSPEGRQRVIENRRIFNEAKKLRHTAMNEVIKESGGKKPPNLDSLVEQKISPQMNELADRFRSGIDEALEDHLPSYNMLAPDGTIRKVPGNKLRQAVDAGLKFT